MKICTSCKLPLENEQFYKGRGMADGRLNQCKTCVKANVARYQAQNLESIREYDRQRGQLPERKARVRAFSRRYRAEGRGIEVNKRWFQRNPEKYRAYYAVHNAIRDGKLFKQPCEVCGVDRVEAHHDDYSKPLEVRWRCKQHHEDVHHRASA